MSNSPPEDFERCWEELIIKIEKQSLDSQAVNKVTEQFLNNKHFFLLSRDGGNFTDELGELCKKSF